MVDWIVGKLKWLLVICAVGGPIVAVACWQDGDRRRAVMAEGIEAVASVEGATRVKRRRGGTSYKLELSWTDAKGLTHRAEDVSISHALARKIIVNDRLTVGSLPIKYMASTPDDKDIAGTAENLVILDDQAAQEETDRELVYVGSGAGVLGLIGSAFMFLPWRRRRETMAA